MFRSVLNFSKISGPRFYATRGHKLSKNVKTAGKGKTLIAKKLTKRQELSIPKKRTVKPTTLDMGDFAKLKGVSIEERTVHRNLLDKVSGFKDLRVHPLIRDCVETDLNIHSPTAIQKVAIKALRTDAKGTRTWLLAAETGSGKTLAYLLPMLSDLIETPREDGPALRAIILVPTLELVRQVGHSLRQLSGDLRVFAETAPSTYKLTRAIVYGLDVLVTTPDKLLNFNKQEPALQERVMPLVQHLVVDEADSLLNESFAPSTMAVIAKCEELKHLVFCTATIPNHFDKVLRQNYPQTNRLITPSIHRLPRHIDFRVIDVWRAPYHDRKPLALQQALYSIYNDHSEPGRVKRVVVFVNKKSQVDPLVSMVRKSGYDAIGMDSKFTADERYSLLEDFVKAPKQFAEGENSVKVLIATDLVARGIDMNRVRNVILYDLPWSSADLLHRAGRTGRLNSKGRVLLFVSRKDSKGWVKGLEKIVKQGMALA